MDRTDGRLHRQGLEVRPGRHPAGDVEVAHGGGRQDLRPAILRRVVVPDVPQGPVREGGHRDARAADVGPGRPVREAARRLRARAVGHLPAWVAGLEQSLGAADDDGQHLRGHLVHEGLAATADGARVQGGDELLRRPRARARAAGRGAVGLHGVPAELQPGQGGDVVRRDLGGGLGREQGRVEGRRQGQLRARAGQGDRRLGLALRVGVGHRGGEQEQGQRLEVHLMGVEQGVREARRRGARLGEGPRRQAQVCTRTPSTRRRHHPSTRSRRPRSRRPTRTTRVSSRDRLQASSSSASPSSRNSARTSRRASAERSPDASPSTRRSPRARSWPRRSRRTTASRTRTHTPTWPPPPHHKQACTRARHGPAGNATRRGRVGCRCCPRSCSWSS